MSRKFRALVGAMLSASICSSCVSSGLSNGVKWAVGVPVTGALVYFGRLGLLEMNRCKKVDICAKKIKKLVGEDNYNVLKKFYELEKENLENSDNPVGSKLASERLILKSSAYCNFCETGNTVCKDVNEVMSWFKDGKSDLLDKVSDHLKFLFNSIFVSGDFMRLYKDYESEFIFEGFEYGAFVVSFSDDEVSIHCRDADYELDFILELSKAK